MADRSKRLGELEKRISPQLQNGGIVVIEIGTDGRRRWTSEGGNDREVSDADIQALEDQGYTVIIFAFSLTHNPSEDQEGREQ